MLVTGNFGFSWVLPYAMRLMSESAHVKCLWKNDDFNLYLYHHKYWKNPILANQALLNNAIILVKMKQYEQAAQALDAMHIENVKRKK